MRRRTSLLFLLALGGLIGWISGCSGGSSGSFPPLPLDAGAAEPLTVSVQADSSRGASAVLGPGGGVLEAAGSDGTLYRLEIPARALPEEQEITLTPLLRAEGLPPGSSLLNGVQFGPDGLVLMVPATLTVTPPAPLPGDALPLGFLGEGQQVHPALTTPGAGGALVFPILHFSGAGTASAGTDLFEFLEHRPPETPLEQAVFQIVRILTADFEHNGEFTSQSEVQVEALLLDFYEIRVKPALSAAVDRSGGRLRRALERYVEWLGLIQTVQAKLGLQRNMLETQQREARELAAARLHEQIGLIEQEMVATDNWRPAAEVLNWFRMAEALQLDDPARGLDLNSVINGLPLQILVELTAPDEITEFGEITVEIRAGVSVGGQPPHRDAPLRIDLDFRGANLSSEVGETDSTGYYERSGVSLSDGSRRIDITARAALNSVHSQIAGTAQKVVEGQYRLVLGAPERLDNDAEGTVSARLFQGRGYAPGETLDFAASAGTLDPTSALTASDGRAVTTLRAPASGSGTAQVVVTFPSGGNLQDSVFVDYGPASGGPVRDDLVGTYLGTHSGLTGNCCTTGPGSASISVGADRVIAYFYESGRVVYAYSDNPGPWTQSGTSISGTGLGYLNVNSTPSGPGTFAASLNQGVLTGSATLDYYGNILTVTFTAQKQ